MTHPLLEVVRLGVRRLLLQLALLLEHHLRRLLVPSQVLDQPLHLQRVRHSNEVVKAIDVARDPRTVAVGIHVDQDDLPHQHFQLRDHRVSLLVDILRDYPLDLAPDRIEASLGLPRIGVLVGEFVPVEVAIIEEERARQELVQASSADVPHQALFFSSELHMVSKAIVGFDSW